MATPFKGPGRVSEHVRKNMYKTLIQKMQNDGILPPAKAGMKTSYLISVELDIAT